MDERKESREEEITRLRQLKAATGGHIGGGQFAARLAVLEEELAKDEAEKERKRWAAQHKLNRQMVVATWVLAVFAAALFVLGLLDMLGKWCGWW